MILLPENESREFKYGVLKNGLKYTVVRDQETNVSNIAVSIRAGAFNDPNEYMGLAHFLEHMLFMGSKKYKDEHYFMGRLSDLGGDSNAYTDLFETVYYLNVLSKNLKEILDIFSRFFIDPLFDINCVSREINAVNSEHMKNLNSDLWINRQLIFTLTKKNSKSNRFTTGSHETLGDDIQKLRNEMIKFYNKYYCANNMTLTITSDLNISDVEDMIKEFFNEVKYQEVSHTNFDEEKFDSFNNEYILRPVKDNNYILYYWDVKSKTDYLYDKTIDIIDKIINLNSFNNLKNILIKSNYSTGIMTNYLENGIYILVVYITPEIDIKEVIVNVNIIIKNYFDNLNKLNWNALYKYILDVSEFNYNHSNKEPNSDLVTDICINMHYFPEKYIYCGDKLIISDNFEKIFDVLKLLVFSKVNIIYGTKDKLKACNKDEMKIEPYYKKKYCKLNKSFIDFKTVNLNINIPIKELNINPIYIRNLNNIIPIKLTNNFWYGGVSKFNETIVIGRIYINHKKLYNTVLSSLTTMISINIINYYIKMLFFEELSLGYIINFNSKTIKGFISLSIVGYNDKYIEFFNNVLEKLRNIKPSKEIINLHINKQKETTKNISKLSPWEYINMITQENLYDYVFPYTEYLSAFNHIKITDIINRINQLIHFTNLPVLTIIYGNINKNNLDRIYTYYTSSNTSSNTISPSIYSKKPKHALIRIKHPNELEKNKCVQFILRYPHNSNSGYNFTALLSAQFLILNDMISKPAFDELRTKQQLGYLVSAQFIFDGSYYIKIKVQSELDTNIIISKINDFLLLFNNILHTYDNDNFNLIKKSIYLKLNKKYANITDIVADYMPEIYDGHYMFNRKAIISSMLSKIKLNDIKRLYHSILQNKYTIIIN